MGIHRSRTSKYHVISNRHLEILHRMLHTALSHYLNQSHSDWHLKLPYCLMAYHSTPHSTTGYSPFILLHGREMVTPVNENLRAKVLKPTHGPEQQNENLKVRLRQAYKAVAKANRKTQASNKQRYDRHAKLRCFKVGDYVYLYNPVRKPGLSKFSFCMDEPISSMVKLSDLNYELLGHNDRKFIVHINHLKPCHSAANRKLNAGPKWLRKRRATSDDMTSAKREAVIAPQAILSYPLVGDNSPDRDSQPATSTPVARLFLCPPRRQLAIRKTKRG